MKYAYYPGCSLECNAAAYDDSVREVADLLGIKLQDARRLELLRRHRVLQPGRIDRLCRDRPQPGAGRPADRAARGPCAACYLNLKKTDQLMADHPEMGPKVNECLAAGGLELPARPRDGRHMLDVIVDDIGETAIRDKVVRPLAGLRVAPYYGCQVVRPIEDGDSTEYPMKMDRLLDLAGGGGGRLSGQGPLLRRPHDADQRAAGVRADPPAAAMCRRADADMILCMCPMCQLNLDGYQARVNGFFGTDFNLPIMYFTQMLGIAFGLEPKKLGFGKELVPAMPVLKSEVQRTIGGECRIEGLGLGIRDAA